MFDDLDLFLHLAEHGNLNRASRDLRLPKSTLSRRLSALEQELDATLFLRKSSGLELTREGKLLFHECSGPMSALRNAVATARIDSASLKGCLRVTMPRAFASFVCAPVLRTFSSLHPEVTLELSLHDDTTDTVPAGWDVAIRVGPISEGDLRVRHLGELRGVIVASPEYLARWGTPTAETLHEHRAVVYRSAVFGPRWEMLDPSGARWVFDVNPSATSNDLGTLRELALLGMGIARGPRYLVLDDLRAGRLLEVLPGWTTEPRKVQALYPEGRRSSARVRVFLDHLVRKLRTLDLNAPLPRAKARA